MSANISAWIDPETLKKFNKLCEENGLVKQTILENLIKKFLRDPKITLK